MAKSDKSDTKLRKPDTLPHDTLAEIVESVAAESGLSREAVSELMKKIFVELDPVLVRRETWESFSGPMPHPELLRLYDAQVPGMAREHWDEIREEGKTDRWCRKAEAISIIMPQIFGFILGMTGLMLGYGLAKDGAGWPSISAMLGGLGTIVASICGKYFFYKEKRK